MSEQQQQRRKGAKSSFCIPRAAISALIDAKADAPTIGAYLTLACFTEATGVYSTASIKAMRQYMSINQERAKKALTKLKAITVTTGSGKQKKTARLVYGRDEWTELTGEVPPDGPVERSRVLHVLPSFDEELKDRIWFSNNIVLGIGTFRNPLKRVKDAGDSAARLLLLMQQAVDMGAYGGIPPHAGPWHRYDTTLDEEKGPARIIHGQNVGMVANTALMAKVGGEQAFWDAAKALDGSGLFYEVVLVMNRNPEKRKFASGGEYGDVPADAEPLYELDTRSHHGYKPSGEEGLAGATANTVGEIGYPVTTSSELAAHTGRFYGKYAAIVPRGYPAMIVGIYRPRFRVANQKNAGVSDAWARIRSANIEGLEWINHLRKAAGLDELAMPSAHLAATSAEQSISPETE